MKKWWMIVQLKTALTCDTTSFMCFCFQKSWKTLKLKTLCHAWVLSLLVLWAAIVYLYKDNLQVVLFCLRHMYIYNAWHMICQNRERFLICYCPRIIFFEINVLRCSHFSIYSTTPFKINIAAVMMIIMIIIIMVIEIKGWYYLIAIICLKMFVFNFKFMFRQNHFITILKDKCFIEQKIS